MLARACWFPRKCCPSNGWIEGAQEFGFGYGPFWGTFGIAHPGHAVPSLEDGPRFQEPVELVQRFEFLVGGVEWRVGF